MLGFVIIIVGLLALANFHENATKKLLANELNHLSPPPTCKEVTRTYQTGSIDTISEWSVSYTCKTSVGQASNFLATSLKTEGLIPDARYAQSFLSLSYAGEGFDIEYEYMGLPDRYSTINNTTPLTYINLSISRHRQ
jgi:hypothetical protein